MRWRYVRVVPRLVSALVLVAGLLCVLSLPGSPAVPAAFAQVQANLPGNVSGSATADMWRAVRRGVPGWVSIPDKKAAVLVQSEGENLRAIRNGPLSVWGARVLLAAVVLMAMFFAVRGRIRIDAGASGRTVQRFGFLERFTHWLAAISFLVLALTGLNMLYGRDLLEPSMGKPAFAAMTSFGRYAHHYFAFAFMLGVVLMLILWVRSNLPAASDLKWLARGGGLFSKGVHPPAHKFNAGQKLIFWAVILLGSSIALSGVCLLLPFQIHPFAAIFRFIDLFGFHLPTSLTPLQETQLALLWHGAVALLLIAIMLAHIYIGSVGMEGAFDAMVSGRVDANWAREHHSLWVAEIEGQAAEGG